ncbi:MAG: hypothetical protein WAK55_14625 [Xanthobacteraceae bacterium]
MEVMKSDNGKWKPGQSGNINGRPVGHRTRHAFSASFLADLTDVWAEHGKATMVHTAKINPETFFAVCSRLIPKDVELTIRQAHTGLDEADLAILRAIKEAIPDAGDRQPGEVFSAVLEALRHFAEWCRQRALKFCPAKPATIAMFIRTESANHVPADKILAALRAIEQLHADQGEANPVACPMPRLELEKITNIEAPRTWPKVDRPLFQSLPPEVRAVIKRNADSTSLALRRLQNKVAAISKKEIVENDDPKTND